MHKQTLNSRLNAYLIYLGVAIASGGVALYTPLIVSETGIKFSGFWAASILCGLNLGRVIGSWLGSRFPATANHPLAVSGNILLEGIALYCMAFLEQAWALAIFAVLAGLGSGLSFPGLKFYLLKLRDLDQTALFSRLSFAIRIGLVAGYLLAGWIPHHTMKLVFLIVLITFISYGLLMLAAMRAIVRHESNLLQQQLEQEQQQKLACDLVAGNEKLSHERSQQSELPLLFYLSNAVFWCFAVQPTIGFSLHIPKFTPDLSVSTPFWIAAVVIIAFQIPVSKQAVRNKDHFRFLQFGYLSLFLSFLCMLAFPAYAATVIIASVLLSFAQIFYGPSLDVLTARYADRVSADTGQLMSRQMLYQSLGNMTGSLAGGLLFDLAQRWNMPAINWGLLAAGSLVMVILSQNKIPSLYRHATHHPQH